MLREDADFGNRGLAPRDGNEWQARVERWLRLRYGTEFQPVPAAHGGDSAIEGYSTDGNVYQCYGARDGYDVKSLYEHQRNKLTADIGKFISYRERLIRLLPAGFKTRCYILVVPKFESEQLVAHANRKVEEVKSANLPYVSSDFAIPIWTRDDFEKERKQEEESFLVKVPMEFSEPSDEDVSNWNSEHDEWVKNLEWKLPLCTTAKTPKRIRELRDCWIRAHIRVANALHRLRSRSVPIWEKLNKSRLHKERRLAMSYGDISAPMSAAKNAADELAKAMQESVPSLDHGDARELADGIVSKWLQECLLLPKEDSPDGTS